MDVGGGILNGVYFSLSDNKPITVSIPTAIMEIVNRVILKNKLAYFWYLLFATRNSAVLENPETARQNFWTNCF